MIVVDTSVWVEALRNGHSFEAKRLQQLLDDGAVALPAPIRIELLSGVAARDRVRLRRALSALPALYPERSTWTRMEEWTEASSTAGHRFGFADLLIGALAAEHDAEVWSLDADFVRMASLGFVRAYQGRRQR